MPRGDGTGPMGSGPRSGMGAGFCAGDPGPDNVNQIPKLGFGRGSGRRRGLGGGMGRGRRGRRDGFFAKSNPQEERRSLESHRETLQSELNVVNKRLDEFKAQETQEN